MRSFRFFVSSAFLFGALAACGPESVEEPEVGAPPVVEILSGPQARTNATAAAFELACEADGECVIFCGLEPGDLEPCDVLAELEGLADGEHVFAAYGVAGELESAVVRWSWEVDTLAPEVLDLEGPGAITNADEGVFSFRCSKEVCSFECSLNDGGSFACEPGVRVTGLSDGEQRFAVWAEDDLGNLGEPATWSWEVDRDVPLIEGLVGPAALTNEGAAEFDFQCSREECEFSCSLDQGAFAPCSPPVAYDDLADGARSFAVYAVDGLGNQGPSAEWVWRIDRVAPQVVDLQGPTGEVNQTAATLTFGCSKESCEFECSLNGAGFVACESGEELEGLADGDQVFAVRATDGAGNSSDVAVWTWTVDTEVPQVTDLQGPPALTNSLEAVFEFGCSKDDCTFECSVNGGDYMICFSGGIFALTGPGQQSFAVRATDSLGSVGPAAA